MPTATLSTNDPNAWRQTGLRLRHGTRRRLKAAAANHDMTQEQFLDRLLDQVLPTDQTSRILPEDNIRAA